MNRIIISTVLISLSTLAMACDVESVDDGTDSLRSVELLDVERTEEGHALTLAVANHSDRDVPMPTVEYTVEVDGEILEVGMVPLDGSIEASGEEEVSLTIESTTTDPNATFEVDSVEWSSDEPQFRLGDACDAWVAMCDAKLSICTNGVKYQEVSCDPRRCKIACFPAPI